MRRGRKTNKDTVVMEYMLLALSASYDTNRTLYGLVVLVVLVMFVSLVVCLFVCF